jgi:hypothetical protein
VTGWGWVRAQKQVVEGNDPQTHIEAKGGYVKEG